MVRVLCREVILALAALATLALAAGAMDVSFGPPAWPRWPGLLDGDAAALGVALRQLGYGALALCAFALLVRLVAGWIVLRQLQIPVLTQLADAVHVSEVVAVAGAVRLVLSVLGGGDTAAAASMDPGRAARPVHTLPQTSRAPGGRPPGHSAADHAHAPTATVRRHARHRRGRTTRAVIHRPVLIYTVQRGDTLSLIAENLYGDADLYRRLVLANRGLRQADGGALEDPNLIRPGWRLRVPLPVRNLSVSGDEALYVVQPGESESLIAARFLGDWKRYTEIDRLSRGVVQPDGGTLTDSNLIQPGWILRLPLQGAIEPVSVRARLKTHLRPRGRAGAHLCHHPLAHARTTAPQPLQEPARHLQHHVTPAHAPQAPIPHPRPQPAHQPRHHGRERSAQTPCRVVQAQVRTPHAGQGHAPHPEGHVVPPPPAAATEPRPVHEPRRRPHHRPPSRPPGRVHVRMPVTPRPPGAHPGAPGTGARDGQVRPTVPPMVRLPGSDRSLPLTLVLSIVGLSALLALLRLRGRLRVPDLAGGPLVRSMQAALRAVQDGVPGLLAARLGRVSAAAQHQGNAVAHVLAALAAVGNEAGVQGNLARMTRSVMEGTETMSLVVEAPPRRLPDAALSRLAATLAAALGTPVQAERMPIGAGTPCVRLALTRGAIAVSTQGWGPGQGRAHPAPLVVPVGSGDHGIVHLNLARSGAMLVAGGAHGSTTLTATLLASTLLQAHPREVRLLVASNDDDLRGILPVLEHLEAPPALAGDVPAMAALVDHAFGLLVERFTQREEAPAEPAYLLVLDDVEALCADRRALDRLGVLCQNGHTAGIAVLATTSDPLALGEEKLLDWFPTRFVRRVGPQESAVLCGDARATLLDARQMLVQVRGQPWEQVSLFTLTLPEVRELCAQLATVLEAEASGQAPPPPGSAAAPADGPVLAPAVPAEGAPASRPPATPGAAPVQATGGTVSAVDAPAAVVPEVAPPEAPPKTAMPDPPHGAAAPAAGAAEERAELPVRPPLVPTEPPITVTVFGGIIATVQGRPVRLEPKHKQVLAVLAVLGPKPVPAQRIAMAVFGEDCDEDRATDLLQQNISVLRRRLHEATGLNAKSLILRDSSGYWLNPEAIRVDYYTFQVLLRESTKPGTPPEQRGRLLAAAVDLYGGDLCGDQEMAWLTETGAVYACRQQYCDALDALVAHYRDVEGDLAQASRLARRRVEAEPDDAAYTQLMTVQAAQGDESGLLTTYRAYCAVLQDLDVDEAAYTQAQALYDTLRAQARAARRPAEQPATTASDAG